MKKYLKFIGGIVLGISCVLGASVVHANEYPAQLTTYQVIGSGSTVGDTTLTLNSFNDIYGNAVTMSYFGVTGYGTIEPNNGSQEEAISFTGLTPNGNGTVSLTGVQDTGLHFPFATTTNGIQINHAGGVTFVITNTAAWYYNLFPIAQNPSVITNNWTFASATTLTATSTASTSLTNLGWVQALISSATSSQVSGLLASNNTWTGTNTFSNTLTANGSNIFGGAATFNGGVNAGGNKITNLAVPTNPTDAASKTYVDGVAISGAPISSNIVTGIARSASSTMIQTGSSGATTTPYFIPSILASSTASTTGSIVVVASTTGGIDNSFLKNITPTGTTTLSSTSTLIGSFVPYQIIGYISTTTANTSLTVSFATSSNLRVEVMSVSGSDQFYALNFDNDSATEYGYLYFQNGAAQTSASSSADTKIRLSCSSGGTTRSFYDIGIMNLSSIIQKQVNYTGTCTQGSSILSVVGSGIWSTSTAQINSLTWAANAGSLGTTTITVYGTPNQ